MTEHLTTEQLVTFRDADEWKSTGYQSHIQQYIGDEIMYRNYLKVHGKEGAEREYPKHSKLREMISLTLAQDKA